tara:strand:- start:111 stop:287 length:177 start_codon:yes stop_codon:yes gene_type:complete
MTDIAFFIGWTPICLILIIAGLIGQFYYINVMIGAYIALLTMVPILFVATLLLTLWGI